jgi:homoserine kinase type II
MKVSEDDARAVLGRYGMFDAALEPLGNAGGFSGAQIWRVRLGLHDFALKRWSGKSPERHEWIVRLMCAAREACLAFVPKPIPTASGALHVEYLGELWDLTEWMLGIANYHAKPTAIRLRAACTTLARLHRVWERFAADLQQCPGVLRRIVIVRNSLDATVGPPGRTIGTPTFTWPLAPCLREAERLVDWFLPRIEGALRPWQFAPMAVQPCLCDIWHDHVLFTGDEVTGLIDYGAMKLDNVAVDLARLLGSLVGNDDELYELGLDAYASVRPLTVTERGLVRVIDRTSLILGLANWCRRLIYTQEEFDDRTAVGRRIEELVRRAEKLKR